MLVMKDPYIKLTISNKTTKTNATIVNRIFLEHCVANYGIQSILLTDYSPILVSKFFVGICSPLGLIKITTTDYNPHNKRSGGTFQL